MPAWKVDIGQNTIDRGEAKVDSNFQGDDNLHSRAGNIYNIDVN